jgi:hypothetical protein
MTAKMAGQPPLTGLLLPPILSLKCCRNYLEVKGLRPYGRRLEASRTTAQPILAFVLKCVAVILDLVRKVLRGIQVRKLFFAIVIVSIPLLPSDASAELIPGSSFQRGNWDGGAYTYDDGTFSHCAIFADYQSGDTLFLTVSGDASIGIGIDSSRLGMQPGNEYAVSVRIDQRYFSQAIAEARDEQFFVFFLTDFSQALDAIRFGSGMFVQGNGFFGEYALTGTAVALETARQCAVAYLDYRAPGISPQSPSQPEAVSSGFDRTYLFQAATEMITALELRDPRYFTEAEMREAGVSTEDVYWFSEEANLMGGVYIAPSQGQSLSPAYSPDRP